MTTISKIEILAPAGNHDALDAALKSKAGAVYFGLTSINARRGATNFEPSELADVVTKVHQAGAKAYLALNITLSDREVGNAFRCVELASQAKVDAIIICDPALLFLPSLYPEVEFHFSTQAACCNDEDIKMAKTLGIKRVVLARENSLSEIKTMTTLGVDTEVFVQGALCFAISGRCLLSSWGGGRSGNRGACTSPCRVPWGVGESAGSGTPFSMHDLGAVEHIPELIKYGVTSLKIEGRLKKGEWVSSAVELFKNAIEEKEQVDSSELGNYTGRKLTSGFLKGECTKMTGQSGRTASEKEEVVEEAIEEKPEPITGITLSIDPSGPKIALKAVWGAFTHSWEVTKSKANKKRAMTLSQVAEVLMDVKISNTQVTAVEIPNEDHLFPNRFSGKVVDELYTFVRVNQKVVKTVKITLPSEVKELSLKPSKHTANSHKLGEKPTVIRVDGQSIKNFEGLTRYQYILENCEENHIDEALKLFDANQLTVALPDVFYSASVDALTTLSKMVKAKGITLEVNSWGGLHIAKAEKCKFVAGPGLAITNGRAGDKLRELGCEKVYWSIEADRKILKNLSQSTPLPARMTVAGHPVLMKSRLQFPEQTTGKIFKDRREISMKLDSIHGVTTLRTVKPFSLLKQKDDQITAAEYVVDLTGLENPRKELKLFLSGKLETASLFNFDRSLY